MISWSNMEQISYSDHLQIAICINKRIQMGGVYKGQPRWKSSEVVRKAYTEAVENSVKFMEILKNYQRSSKK